MGPVYITFLPLDTKYSIANSAASVFPEPV